MNKWDCTCAALGVTETECRGFARLQEMASKKCDLRCVTPVQCNVLHLLAVRSEPGVPACIKEIMRLTASGENLSKIEDMEHKTPFLRGRMRRDGHGGPGKRLRLTQGC